MLRTRVFSNLKDDGSKSKTSRPGGVLELSLAYDTKHSTLVVSVVAIYQYQAIISGRHHDIGSIASPYVRLQLLLSDGRRLKAKTRVVRTLAAAADEMVQFGETFAFRDLSTGLPGSRLHAAVLGFDRFSRDSILGEVTMALDDNRLLLVLADRCGVLETLLLNIEPTPEPQSSLTKVSRIRCKSSNCHIIKVVTSECSSNLTARHLQATLSKLLTYNCVLRST